VTIAAPMIGTTTGGIFVSASVQWFPPGRRGPLVQNGPRASFISPFHNRSGAVMAALADGRASKPCEGHLSQPSKQS